MDVQEQATWGRKRFLLFSFALAVWLRVIAVDVPYQTHKYLGKSCLSPD